MIEVKITEKVNFEKAIRLFKKFCQRDGFMMELKDRKFYIKPSEKRRLAAKKSR